jgi:hypothetical protein
MNAPSIKLGLKENIGQFSLLVLINAFVGAITSGLIADIYGIHSAIWFIAVLTFFSGLVTAIRQDETMIKRLLA